MAQRNRPDASISEQPGERGEVFLLEATSDGPLAQPSTVDFGVERVGLPAAYTVQRDSSKEVRGVFVGRLELAKPGREYLGGNRLSS
jgi:hypothetical protein